MTPTVNANEKIYYGSLRGMRLLIVLSLLVIPWMVWLLWNHFLEWQKLQAIGNVGHVVLEWLSLGFACWVLYSTVVSHLKKLPRVKLSVDGLEFQTVRETTTARWSSLGTFVPREMPHYTHQGALISAPIVGSEVSPNLIGKTFFDVTGEFKETGQQFADEINLFRLQFGPAVADISTIKAKMTLRINPVAFLEPGFPVVTTLIMIILIALYMFEVGASEYLTHSVNPTVRTLLLLGGIQRPLVLVQGQWLRLFSGPLLHGGFVHLAMNGISLIFAGKILERMVGKAWFTAIFVLGAFGGALTSLGSLEDTTVSVGASGAIMALFVAAVICTQRIPVEAQRTRLKLMLLRVIIPSLLPITSIVGVHVDYGAHFGGAMTGALIGLFLIKNWPDDAAVPKFRALANAISVVSVFFCVVSFWPVWIRLLHAAS